MPKQTSQDQIQRLADISLEMRSIAVNTSNLLNQQTQTVAAAEANLQSAIENSFSSVEHLKKTKTKDKQIKNNLAYRFPVVRKKYAMLLASASTSMALSKSNEASARSVLLSLTKKLNSTKKKFIASNKASEEAEKQLEDAISAFEKTSTTEKTPTTETEKTTELQQIVGNAHKKQRSQLFRSIEKTRDKAIDPSLERHVLGDIGDNDGDGAKKGVRISANEFAQANPNIFKGDGVEANAARSMLEEAVILAESSLKATPENSGKILGRLKYLEKVAIDAGEDILAKKILEIIKPVKASLSKKNSFASLIKQGIGDHIEGFKTHMIKNLPIVGGMLENIRQKKKADKAETKDYRDSMLEKISRGGQRGGGLDFRGKVADGDDVSSTMRDLGATPASETGIMSGLIKGSGVGDIKNNGNKSPILDILKATYDKIASIHDLLHESIDPEENALTAREKEFEGRGIGSLGLKGKGGGVGEAQGQDATSSGGGLSIGDVIGGSMVGRIGGKALGAVSRIGGKALPEVPVTPASSGKALTTGGGLLSKAGGMLKGLGGKAIDFAKSGGKGILSSVVKSSGGIAKFAKFFLKAPLIGPIISAGIAAMSIAGIKSDPSLSKNEKKEQIGKTIGSGLGGIIGSAGGGILGSIVPGLGTLIGAVGGGLLGDWIGGLIADGIGGKEIYDIMESIPGIGSLISVEDGASEDALPQNSPESGSSLPTAGAVGDLTTVGKQASEYNNIMNEVDSQTNQLNDAKYQEARNMSGKNIGSSNKQSNVISNNNTNIHISEGTRNSEPTIKQMQRESV